MIHRLLSFLLHVANTRPPFYSEDFYAVKYKLLSRHGTTDGFDIQEIVRKCYGHWDADEGEWAGCTHDEKCKCGGDGIFQRRIYNLRRYKWGKYLFHIQLDTTAVKGPLITIHGKIEHAQYRFYGAAGEAALWLYLLTGNFRQLWRSLRGCSYAGWFLWPMLNLQRVVFKLSMMRNNRIIWFLREYFRSSECFNCHKKFRTWGRDKWYCSKCLSQMPKDEQVPF